MFVRDRRSRSGLPAALAALTCAPFLAAAVALAGDAGPNLHFERIGTEGGPPPAVITALRQDRDGFIWIGSRNGLTLFDGHDYTTFQHDPTDSGSLSDNTIRTIYEDDDGTLWFGTNTGGLNRYDAATRTFVAYRHDSGDPGSLSHDSVYAVLRDRRGSLWVGTQKGLNRLDADSGRFERYLAGGVERLVNDYVLTLYEDRAGRVWVGTLGGGLSVWDDERERFETFRHDPSDPTSLIDDRVSTLFEDETGALWVGSLAGLGRLDPGRRTFTNFGGGPGNPSGLQDALITALAPGVPGHVWVGTHGGGIADLDTATGRFRTWKHESSRRGSLGEDVIIALLADRAGALWIGTWGGGLNRLSHASQRFGGPGAGRFPPADVPDRDVTAMMCDRGERIWIGTRTGYLLRLDPDSGHYDTMLLGGDRGVSRILLDLVEDRRGRIWGGTNAGILRLDPVTGATKTWEHDPDDPGSLGPGYVTSLLEDSRGRMWVGTGEGGLQRLGDDGAIVERLTHDAADPASLSDDYVTAVLEDTRGALWVGTRSGGLNEVDPATGRAQRFLPEPGNPASIGHHYVTALLEDTSGRLWAGTAGGGLNRIVRGDDGLIAFDRITENDGLIDDDVTGILQDDDGSLWVSTRNGLSRYHPELGAFTNLFVSDGLPSAEFEANSVARSGSLLSFGSVRGLVTLAAGTDFELPSPSPVVVRSVRTAAGEIPGRRPGRAPDRLELPFGTWLSIDLAVLDYSPELEHRYAYRLEDDWIEIGGRREITFTALRPGSHALRIRGRNSQGVWSEAVAPLQITVVPPFWMTWPFRLLAVAVVAATAFGAHRRRTSVLERRNRELVELHRERESARQNLDQAFQRLRRLTRRLEAAKEDERKRIARELHDEMGPSLTAVIINLQLLAQQREPEKVARKIEDTVDLVDRLVQRIRDISLDLRPPLIDELGLVPAIGGYLESISERTGLTIRLHGKEEVGPLPADVPITAFRVVQEAVTNVIRHAGASTIDVSVQRNGAGLDLCVEDDGAGFDVGDTMERAASGKALGLLGMQERVGMSDGEIDIDSTPGDGTRIRVRLPLQATA